MYIHLKNETYHINCMISRITFPKHAPAWTGSYLASVVITLEFQDRSFLPTCPDVPPRLA